MTSNPNAPAAMPSASPERVGLGGGSDGLGTTGGGVTFGASASGTAVRVGPGSVGWRAPGASGAANSISVRSGLDGGTSVGALVTGSISVSGPYSTGAATTSGKRCVILGLGSAYAAVVAI